MAIPLNPLPLQNYDLRNPKTLPVWQNLIAQALSGMQYILNRLQDPVFLSGILNGQAQVKSTALYTVVGGYTSSASQNLDCTGAAAVGVEYIFTGNSTATVTLSHLSPSVPITISVNFNTHTSTLFIAATDPSGTSLGVALVLVGTSGLQTGISSTFAPGVWIGSGMQFSGGLWISFGHS